MEEKTEDFLGRSELTVRLNSISSQIVGELQARAKVPKNTATQYGEDLNTGCSESGFLQILF